MVRCNQSLLFQPPFVEVQQPDHFPDTGFRDDAGLTVVQEESLPFISEEGQPRFTARHPLAENARRMAALDGNSLMHCLDGLLPSAAEENIVENTHMGLTDEEARRDLGE